MERPEWLPTWACQPPEQRVLAAKSHGRIVERFDLNQAGFFLLGRNSEVCDVPLRHSSSSRTHAAVFFDSEGRAYLRDLSSTHGTFLNGERIDRGSQAELGHRDVFSLGTDPIEYRVEAEQDGRGLEEGSGGPAEGYGGEEEAGRGRRRAYDAVPGRDEQEWEQRRGRGSPQDHGSPGWRERRVEGAEWQERRSKRARTGEDGRRYRDREASPNDGERPSSRDRWEEQPDRARGRYGERDRARPRGDYEAERSSRRDHGGRDYRERDHRRDDHDGYHHERWHSKLYTVMCKFYNTPQGCRNGDRCRFKHVREGGSRHRRRDGSPDSYDHSDDERRRRRRRHSSPENSPPPKPASGGSCFKDMIPRFERSGPNPMMAAVAASGAAPANATAAPAAGGAAALPPAVPGPTAVAGAPAAPGASSLDIVKKMMAVPGQSGLSLDEKKKLLWGRKDASGASAAAAAPGTAEQSSAAEPGPGAPASGSSSYGANRWDAAEFDTQEERQRFHKLMGVRQQSGGRAGDAGEDDEDCERVALNRANQEKVLSNLEQQFVAGKRRADGRTLGMGL